MLKNKKSICLLPYIPMLIKNSPIFQQKKAFYTFTGMSAILCIFLYLLSVKKIRQCIAQIPFFLVNLA